MKKEIGDADVMKKADGRQLAFRRMPVSSFLDLRPWENRTPCAHARFLFSHGERERGGDEVIHALDCATGT
jgi:hypothetical protein